MKEIIAQRLSVINFDGTARFVVRSSGVIEESEEKETSITDQNDTFLGLKKNDEVFDAILKCWASLYSVENVLYRK